MISQFDGKRAYAHLEKLTLGIGPRHGGSAQERKAATYIRNAFKSFGLKTSFATYLTHTFSSASASVSFSGIGDVNCLPVPLSGSTPARGITADLVFVEVGHAMLLEPSMSGKIIMTYGDFSGEHYERLFKLKPAGVISIATQANKGLFRGQFGAEQCRKFGTIPMIRISYNDGQRIRVRGSKRCSLKVKTTGAGMEKSHNVIGELRGSTLPDEIIVVGGHYDTVWGTQGGQDNAGGTAIVMELARLYAGRGSTRTLRFMAFGGEEQGLRGSRAYVKKLKDADEKLKKDVNFERDGLKSELDRIRFMINIDVHGSRLGRNNAWTCGHPDIAASVRLLSSEVRAPYNVMENKIYSSDNAPFGKGGVPSLSFARAGGGSGVYFHTDDDVIDHCDADGLANAGRFIEAWMNRYVLGCAVFPFERSIPEVAQKGLNDYFRNKAPFDYVPQVPTKRYKPKRKKRAR